MSEQTANLCTTDAAESLRAVVAERDREIERLNSDYNEACEDAMCVARELERQKMNCLNLLQQLEDLKAQPSGVVLPDPKKEIVAWGHDMGGNYDEGHADGWNDALDEVARLNSSPVSAGDDLTASECACGDQYTANSYGAGFMAANGGVCENCDASAPSHGEQVRKGWKLVPVEPTPEMISAAEEAHMPFGDMDIALRCALFAAPSPASQKEKGE